MNHKIAYLTNGDRTWASSRLRAWWMEDANPVRFKAYAPGDPLLNIDDYDTVVFQKRYAQVDIERAGRYKAEGRKVIFDITEPQWWFDPLEAEQMITVVDAVTTCTPLLSQAVSMFDENKLIVTIPDRMLPSFHTSVAEHGPRDRVRMVWFGATQNRISLVGALPLISYVSHRWPLELRIIDGAPGNRLDSVTDPERTKVVHIPWALETFHAQLAASDIALLPPYPGPLGALKSNNRHATAWWAGLPVVSGFDLEELMRFMGDAEARASAGATNRKIAEQEFGISKSVAQWLDLAAELHDGAAVQRDLLQHPELLVEHAQTAAGD